MTLQMLEEENSPRAIIIFPQDMRIVNEETGEVTNLPKGTPTKLHQEGSKVIKPMETVEEGPEGADEVSRSLSNSIGAYMSLSILIGAYWSSTLSSYQLNLPFPDWRAACPNKANQEGPGQDNRQGQAIGSCALYCQRTRPVHQG